MCSELVLFPQFLLPITLEFVVEGYAAIVVGATSSNGFLVGIKISPVSKNCIYAS